MGCQAVLLLAERAGLVCLVGWSFWSFWFFWFIWFVWWAFSPACQTDQIDQIDEMNKVSSDALSGRPTALNPTSETE